MAQLSVSVERWKYIGGSDIPIIMNLSPFKTRWQLLREKARLEEPQADPFAKKYIDYGNTMEPIIRNYVNSVSGCEYAEGKHYLKFNGTDVRIHTDGETTQGKKTTKVLEIKTTSQTSDTVAGYKHYIVQLLFYMKMLNAKAGLLAVYERPENFSRELEPERLQLFEVTLGGDFAPIVDEIINALGLFLSDLEKIKANPFLEQADLLSDDETELLNRLLFLRQQEGVLDQIKEERKAIEAKLCDAMKTNGHKTVDGFGWKVTAVPAGAPKQVEKIDFDLDRLRKERPRIFKSYCKSLDTVTKEGRAAYIKLTKLEEEEQP